MQGQVAIADGKYADAIRTLSQLLDQTGCKLCVLPDIARAYDLSGQPDSAISVFARYLATPWMSRVVGAGPAGQDPLYLAGTYKRLGELYEAKGDRAHAEEYYAKFAALWKDSDPELQPKVKEVEKRLARLRASGSS